MGLEVRDAKETPVLYFDPTVTVTAKYSESDLKQAAAIPIRSTCIGMTVQRGYGFRPLIAMPKP